MADRDWQHWYAPRQSPPEDLQENKRAESQARGGATDPPRQYVRVRRDFGIARPAAWYVRSASGPPPAAAAKVRQCFACPRRPRGANATVRWRNNRHAPTRPANRARRIEGTFRTPSTNDGQRRNRPAHPRRIRRKHAWLARRLAPETVQRDRGLLRTAFIGLDRSAISACVSYTLGERPQSSANPCRIGATSPRGLRISGVRPIAASRRRWRIRNGNR